MSKIRLGGMALANGVLVHGPTAWACAIRTASGEIKVAPARKRLFASRVSTPFLRGPLRLAESFAVIPELRRRLPEARLPFERPAVLAAMLASAVTVQRRAALEPAQRRGTRARLGRAVARARRPRAPRRRAGRLPRRRARLDRDLRARRAAREGARALRLAPDRPAARRLRSRQHPRGPRARPPARPGARRSSSIGAVGAAVEVFAWMTRHPGHPLAKALARPGHELQHRIATAEPSPEQLEVAEAALAACLELEMATEHAN